MKANCAEYSALWRSVEALELGLCVDEEDEGRFLRRPTRTRGAVELFAEDDAVREEDDEDEDWVDPQLQLSTLALHGRDIARLLFADGASAVVEQGQAVSELNASERLAPSRRRPKFRMYISATTNDRTGRTQKHDLPLSLAKIALTDLLFFVFLRETFFLLLILER